VAATLADINKTLISVDENTQKTSKGINGFLTYLKGRDAKEDRKELEASREARKVNTRDTQQSSGGGGRFSGFKLPSFSLPSLGALATAATLFTTRLFKRGLIGGLLTGFADEIANFFLPGEPGEKQLTKDLRKYLTGALEGFGLGYILFGKKGGILGGILGALTKNEKVDKELGRLTDNLEKLATVIFGPDYKGGFAAMANSIANLAGDGLTRLNNLVEGKNFSTENIRELGKDILGAAGVLGAFGFFVSPKFRKMLLSVKTLKKLPVVASIIALANLLGYTVSEDGSEGPSNLEIGAGVVGTTYLAKKGYDAFKNRGAGDPRKLDPGYNEKIKAANKLSPSALSKAGLEKAKGGGVQQKGSGRFATNAQLDKALENRYGRIFGPKGIARFLGGVWPLGLLAGILTASSVQQTLADDNLSEDEKRKRIGEELGSSLNMFAFGALGGALGGITFGPKGATVGSILLGSLGALAPNVAGDYLASWFLGRPMSESQLNQITSLNHIRKRAQGGGMNLFQDISSTEGIVSRLPPSSATTLGSNLPNAMTGGGAPASNPNTLITSQNNYSTQNQSLIVGHPNTRDGSNALNQRLNVGLSGT
tara:strand:- start:1704 stop:3494 length:1791 start_codon:yes stop_codon:yes gene_type:complete